MFCKQCGKPIDDGQELCEDCKAKLNQGANNAQPNNNFQDNTQGNVNYNNQNFNNQNFNNQNYNNQNYNNQNYNNQNYNQNFNGGTPQKSKLAAGLLGIFLGSFGVHNFYLGYIGKAVAQLLITLLTCGFGAMISSIWGLIEGILILTGSINVDGKGVPLKD